jgi:hypothetical protein
MGMMQFKNTPDANYMYEPRANLRWLRDNTNSYVLQQMNLVTEYKLATKAVRTYTEWVNVPIVDAGEM